MSRKIVLTGASSEIGQAIAEALWQENDAMVLQCNRHSDALRPWEGRTGVEIAVCDFRDSVQIDRFCHHLEDCDVLVNAAALTLTDLLPNLTDEDVEAMLMVNVTACVRLCRAAVRGMMRRRRGSIVNITSVAASRGNRGQSVYGGTKAFVEAFSRSLCAEFAPRGVRVNCVAPGAIEAGSLRDLLAQAPEELKRCTAAGRLGTPQDVARAVAWLASDASSFVNGQVLSVDGGFLQGVGR
ncbi:MAG: hypothetical protein RL318_1210 [Fibrobacterota bacterium]|jgi:3-oxoacyl-[acyl-carrier protein] reductase